jgi:hypothetical protein
MIIKGTEKKRKEKKKEHRDDVHVIIEIIKK